MKRFVKIVALVLVMVTLFAVPVGAETVENRASSYFMTSNAYLYKTADAQFGVWFSVGAYGIMDEVGASSIAIQRSQNGKSWSTMVTFSKANYPQFIGENTSVHGTSILYTGSRGYYYRAKITLYAKDSSGVGELTRYTSKIQL